MLTILLLASAHAADLSMRVEGLASDDGQVMCTLYANPETWLKSEG